MVPAKASYSSEWVGRRVAIATRRLLYGTDTHTHTISTVMCHLMCLQLSKAIGHLAWTFRTFQRVKAAALQHFSVTAC